MNKLLLPSLYVFVLVYLDDILVYSTNCEDHLSHIKQVFTRLRQYNLYCKASKCTFFQVEVDFLGYVVTKGGFAISPSKVEAIQSWPVPKSRTQLRGFLGLSNYCRKFVPDFSEIVLPLTSLTSDKVPFSWSQDAENAFHTIKEMFISTPVLLMPDASKEFFLETDASDFAVGAVLLQLGGMSYYILLHISARSTFLQKKTTLFMIRIFF